ncbi:MAG: hypothetical protein WD404_06190 [Solirubrobacterales bacterium]
MLEAIDERLFAGVKLLWGARPRCGFTQQIAKICMACSVVAS